MYGGKINVWIRKKKKKKNTAINALKKIHGRQIEMWKGSV